MRYLVISDIHANWHALQAVLADARGHYEAVINCGDIVGYGAFPNEVAEWVQSVPQHIVRGNHDKACAGMADLDWFNDIARDAAVWTASALSAANLAFVRSLPPGPFETDNWMMFHGAPHDEDEYLMEPREANLVRPMLTRGLSWFGHTHVQGGFMLLRNGGVIRLRSMHAMVEETAYFIVNPGSVGQPRDGDPRAAYALYDTDGQRVDFRRVEYDIAAAAEAIAAAGLPEVLGLRLSVGM